MNISMFAKFSGNIKSQGADTACSIAEKLGFTSVEHIELELDNSKPTIANEEDLSKLKYAMDKHGLSMSCYSVAVNLWEKNMTPTTVTTYEKALYNHAKQASYLGSPYLHHTLLLGVEKDSLPFEQALELIVPAAIRVAKFAQNIGISCLYEDQGMYFNGVKNFGRFYSEVKKECPYVGICGDMGNTLFVDEDPVAFFKAYVNEMKHVHIKDYIISDKRDSSTNWSLSKGGKWLKDSIVGEGNVRIVDCLNILKENGYNGALSLENCHAGDFELGVSKAISLLKNNF